MCSRITFFFKYFATSSILSIFKYAKTKAPVTKNERKNNLLRVRRLRKNELPDETTVRLQQDARRHATQRANELLSHV